MDQLFFESKCSGFGGVPTLEETLNFRKSLEGVCFLRRRAPSVNATPRFLKSVVKCKHVLAFLNEKVSSKVGTPPKPEHFDSEKKQTRLLDCRVRTHSDSIASPSPYQVRNLHLFRIMQSNSDKPRFVAPRRALHMSSSAASSSSSASSAPLHASLARSASPASLLVVGSAAASSSTRPPLCLNCTTWRALPTSVML